ncbi:MAG TPA: GNAT family N-acetyltransferase [Sandaracinaceae bacterium LLY-WYZ-13_1]|nr:GNAT family N-acetyltransferase [Sandaracinaceae bacterium LLY-WYZ-13_1]
MRTAHGGDADELARVHLASWRWAYRGLLPDGYLHRLRQDELAARWWRRLAAGELDESIRVLEHDGQVGGFVSFGPLRDDPTWLGYAGEVYMLYLEPELVGLGLGTALLRRAFDELGRCHCHWVVVWVLAKNERARRFYEREGLQLDGARRWDPFGDRAVPVLRYAKALNPVVDFEALRSRSRIG